MFRRILYCLIYYAVLGVFCFPFGRRLARIDFHADAFPFSSRRWERDGKVYDRFHTHHDFLIVNEIRPNRLAIGNGLLFGQLDFVGLAL